MGISHSGGRMIITLALFTHIEYHCTHSYTGVTERCHFKEAEDSFLGGLKKKSLEETGALPSGECGTDTLSI